MKHTIGKVIAQVDEQDSRSHDADRLGELRFEEQRQDHGSDPVLLGERHQNHVGAKQFAQCGIFFRLDITQFAQLPGEGTGVVQDLKQGRNDDQHNAQDQHPDPDLAVLPDERPIGQLHLDRLEDDQERPKDKKQDWEGGSKTVLSTNCLMLPTYASLL